MSTTLPNTGSSLHIRWSMDIFIPASDLWFLEQVDILRDVPANLFCMLFYSSEQREYLVTFPFYWYKTFGALVG